MDSPDRFFIWLSVLAYGLAVLYAAWKVFRVENHSRSVTYILIVAGFVLQSIGLYLRGIEIGGCPLGNTFEIIQFILWSVIFLFLVVGPVFHVNLLGSFSASLAFAMSLLSLLVPGWDRAHETVRFGGDPLIEFHAAVSIFSYGIFGLLAVVSIMYRFQYASLNRKKRAKVYSFLPSIVKLDGLSSRLLHAGLLVLSLAFLSGILVWFEEAWGHLQWKLLIVFVLWLGYTVLGTLRWRGIISPKRSANAFIFLFLIALISLWPLDSVQRNSAELPADVTEILPSGNSVE